MSLISKVLLLTIFLLSESLLAAGICDSFDSQCPQGRTEISLCVIDPDVKAKSFLMRFNENLNCGFESERLVTSKMSEVAAKFKETIKKCIVIKELTFAGHGNPTSLAAGGLDREFVKELEPFSCVMAPNAMIDLLGCSTGKGCLGQAFNFNVAKALLKNGGTIKSKTATTTMILPYPKHVSINGIDRILEYDPKKDPPDKWSYKIPFGTVDSNPEYSCVSEIEEALRIYDNHKEFIKVSKGRCELSPEVHKMAEIVKARKLQIIREAKSTGSFTAISNEAEVSWQWKGERDSRGVGDLAFDMLEAMKPYLSCRRSLFNANASKPQVTGEKATTK